MGKPRFSVVTPSFNQADYIRDNIESVLGQRSPRFDVEHIIVDGGSTDGTLQILKGYPHLKWISGPDGGQADALNKGFAMASGDVIGWLNSDDFYAPGAFEKVFEFFSRNERVDMLYGRCRLVDRNGNFIKEWNPPEFNLRFLLWRGGSFIPQQTVFFRKKILQRLDYVCDVTIADAIDYDLWLRIGGKFKIEKIDETLASFRIQPGAKTSVRPKLQWQESRKARDKYNPYGPVVTNVGLGFYLAMRLCQKACQALKRAIG